MTFREVLRKKITKKSKYNQLIYKREAKTRFGNFKFDSIISMTDDNEVNRLLECLSKTKLKNTL